MHRFAFIGGIGDGALLLILLVWLVLFGAKKIPELARSWAKVSASAKMLPKREQSR